jgi:hypothetical protein
MAGKKRGTFVMRDLQAQHALAREYTEWTHGNMYAQMQARVIPGDAELEAAMNGGKPFDDTGRPSSGYDHNKVCACGIARSRNGAPNCGAETCEQE